MFLAHLRNTLGIRGVKRVTLHERMTALRRVALITMEKGTPRTEVWRALYGATSFRADCGKICIAIDADIDPDNSDAILWALAFRMNPAQDLQVLPHRSQGHGPEREHEQDEEDATLLMDATMKEDLPPLALPKREYMERAKQVWEELGLPKLRPQSPWFGSALGGDWLPYRVLTQVPGRAIRIPTEVVLSLIGECGELWAGVAGGGASGASVHRSVRRARGVSR
jgi:4-hydroxy-3-polyprenylbenzoate decarboxylase